MKPSTLIRWSGLACLLAGLLYALAAVIHPAGEDALSIANPAWAPAHALGAVAALLLQFGLVGVYAVQREKAGRLLAAGFVLAFIGSGLLGWEESQSALIAPVLAARAPDLIDSSNTTLPAAIFAICFLFSFFAGFLMLSVAAIRQRVLPRPSGVLLIAGLVLTFGGALSHLIGVIAACLLGAALIWIGWVIWSQGLTGAETAALALDAPLPN